MSSRNCFQYGYGDLICSTPGPGVHSRQRVIHVDTTSRRGLAIFEHVRIIIGCPSCLVGFMRRAEADEFACFIPYDYISRCAREAFQTRAWSIFRLYRKVVFAHNQYCGRKDIRPLPEEGNPPTDMSRTNALLPPSPIGSHKFDYRHGSS
ncbi:hypothetical protein EJ08DRAFT_89551 [Tothia fuscella]|uniref:Uncharacterized protein n=1 Tax=Tothia fuscella TaxID=1048955 RepID=A0A9P4U1P1_9PEZI|nr:hypothetical protein EJ08DRAFT_89551 [Tothia fuscella]